MKSRSLFVCTFLVSASRVQLFLVFVLNALHGSRHTRFFAIRLSPSAPCTSSIAAYTCIVVHRPFASASLAVLILDNLLTIFGTEHT
jgi:hypothetical protein